METLKRDWGELSRIMSEDAFVYLLDIEVKRAQRYQNFLCVLLFRIEPILVGSREDFEECRNKLSNLLVEDIRETDLLCHVKEDRFAALLPYANETSGSNLRSRLEKTFKYYDFEGKGYHVRIEQMCFPGQVTNTADILMRISA